MKDCPLCNLNKEKDLIFYEDEFIKIVRTKNLKGHRERIMVVTNDHREELTNVLYNQTIKKAKEIGKKLFNYTYKFVIMNKTFGTIQDHWHKVCSDLDPNSEDYEQILGTTWLNVVEVKRWKE